MDIKLNYTKSGTGPAMILLHGNGENLGYFYYQIPFFSENYTVYALDTRGHGKSPRGEGEFTIERFAEDLREFMDEQGIEKATLLGFSDGGNIALTFALRYPERVEKLILNGANLYPAGVERSVQYKIEKAYFRRKHTEDGEMLALMVNEPNTDPLRLRELTMPVLVIAGTRDMILDSHTRLIHRSLPNARLRIIEGDHFIAANSHEEFNREVQDFLTSEGR